MAAAYGMRVIKAVVLSGVAIHVCGLPQVVYLAAVFAFTSSAVTPGAISISLKGD